jgi:hypothetical protein
VHEARYHLLFSSAFLLLLSSSTISANSFSIHHKRAASRIDTSESNIQEHINTAKMVDPVEFAEAVFKTSKLLVPTPSPTPSVSPIPTVIPNVPHYERVGETGTKTLWVSFLPLLRLHL